MSTRGPGPDDRTTHRQVECGAYGDGDATSPDGCARTDSAAHADAGAKRYDGADAAGGCAGAGAAVGTSAGAGGDVVPWAAGALAAAEVYVSEKPERSTLMSVLRMKRSAEELMAIGRGSDAPLSSARSRGVAVCSIGSDREGLQRQTLAQYVHTHLQGGGGRGGLGSTCTSNTRRKSYPDSRSKAVNVTMIRCAFAGQHTRVLMEYGHTESRGKHAGPRGTTPRCMPRCTAPAGTIGRAQFPVAHRRCPWGRH